MSGGFGILAESIRNWALPLSIRIHDGRRGARGWKDASISCASHVIRIVGCGRRRDGRWGGASHVIRMVEDAYRAVK